MATLGGPPAERMLPADRWHAVAVTRFPNSSLWLVHKVAFMLFRIVPTLCQCGLQNPYLSPACVEQTEDLTKSKVLKEGPVQPPFPCLSILTSMIPTFRTLFEQGLQQLKKPCLSPSIQGAYDSDSHPFPFPIDAQLPAWHWGLDGSDYAIQIKYPHHSPSITHPPYRRS
ncbi:hypothetical protein MHYP_G00093820 [Metynnis hypsauchen]